MAYELKGVQSALDKLMQGSTNNDPNMRYVRSGEGFDPSALDYEPPPGVSQDAYDSINVATSAAQPRITIEEPTMQMLPQQQGVPVSYKPVTEEYQLAASDSGKDTTKKEIESTGLNKSDVQNAQQALAKLGATSTAASTTAASTPTPQGGNGVYQRRLPTPAPTARAEEPNDPMKETLGLVGALFSFL